MNIHNRYQHTNASIVKFPLILQVLGLILCIVLITCDTYSSSQDLLQENRTTEDQKSQELLSKLISSSRSQVYQDPFAVTFEDFLKEANRISTHQISSSNKDSSDAILNNEAGLIVEEDVESESRQPHSMHSESSSSHIDYIFPPPKQHTQKHQQLKYVNNPNNSSSLDEVQMMFSWEPLLTHKCSKTCGKGYKMYHLSCIDLKYRVKVEDELCSKANIVKPRELSNESCNEIDCPPKWMSVEFQECTSEFNSDGSCRRNLYKREQCVMVNAAGLQVNLDESMCNRITASSPEAEVQALSSHNHSVAEVVNLDPSSDYSFEEVERNNILSNNNHQVNSNMDSYFYEQGERLTDKSSTNRHNEPFFHVGPWSECAPLNKLGKRTREVICRLYLSRSSKFTDLPYSSCRGLVMPEREEPCYMDSGPLPIDGQPTGINSTDFEGMSYDGEGLDETVYDSDLARYIWRKEGWTRCSAECLGGQKESLIECWDKVAGVVVSQSLCDPQSKPIPTIEECNNIPCPLEWKEGPFSQCSRPCGSAGVRTRSVVCVRKYSHKPDYETFPEEECKQLKDSIPHKLESCNRFDCRPEWNVGPWSECSMKCGEGIKKREVVCVQEFAGRDRPLTAEKETDSDLLEAMMISSHNWHPGKVTQIPFTECYEEYRTVPTLEKKCFGKCRDTPCLDAEGNQDPRMTREPMRRRTLKIGGKVRSIKSKNFRNRCKVRHGHDARNGDAERATTRDGLLTYHNDSRIVDKQPDLDNNLIISTL